MEGEDQAPRVDVGKNNQIYTNNNLDTDLVTDRSKLELLSHQQRLDLHSKRDGWIQDIVLSKNNSEENIV